MCSEISECHTHLLLPLSEYSTATSTHSKWHTALPAHLQCGQLLLCLALVALEAGVGGCQFTDPFLSFCLLTITVAKGALSLYVCIIIHRSEGVKEHTYIHVSSVMYIIITGGPEGGT